jgi:hypothetical protein
MTLKILRICDVNDNRINGCGAVAGMRLDEVNRDTWREHALVSFVYRRYHIDSIDR